jgi:hypothetical protein
MGSDEPGPGQRYALEGKETHRNHPPKKAEGYNRTPLVSCPQGGARKREGGLMGKDGSGRARRSRRGIFDLGSTATRQGKDDNPSDHWHT